MPPVLAAFIGSILRHALTGLAVYFVSHGYFVQSDADNYIAAFIAAVLGLAWSYYQKHQAKLRELVGLGLPPGSTTATIDAKMHVGATPPMTLTGTPLAIFLALALAGTATMPGCAFIKANPRHAAATAAMTVHDALAGVQDQELAIYKAQSPFVISPAEHQKFNRALVQALKDGQAFDRAIEAWPANAAAPKDLPTLVNDVSNSARALLDAVPNPQLRASIAIGISSAQSIALNVLAIAAVAHPPAPAK